MLHKTCAYTGLVIATAAGALLASSPAYAMDGLVRGWHHHSYFRSHHRNHNWNGNRHHARIFIRIYIYNKNNNHAVALARPEHRRHRFWDPGAGVVGGLTAGRAPVAVTNQLPAATPDAPVAAAAPVAAPAAAPDLGTAAAPAAVPLDQAATGAVSP